MDSSAVLLRGADLPTVRSMNLYDREFFTPESCALSIDSARVVVPLLCDELHPASVVDVGCGAGDWLREFIDNGVTDVLGFDGGQPDTIAYRPWTNPKRRPHSATRD